MAAGQRSHLHRTIAPFKTALAHSPLASSFAFTAVTRMFAYRAMSQHAHARTHDKGIFAVSLSSLSLDTEQTTEQLNNEPCTARALARQS